ncbi:MAG: hypothetical protein R3C51_11265 [Parvularculaceae bacterium]
MLFTRDVKADYGTPGFAWKSSGNGSIKGRITSAYPMRFKTRFFVGAGIGFWWSFFTVPVGSFETWLPAALVNMAISYVITVIWPFWPLGASVEISPDYLRIGWNRYRLDEVGTFQTVKHRKAKRHQDREQITFGYGRKSVTLRPINDFKTALRIAEALNGMKEAGLKMAAGESVAQGYADEHSTDQPADNRRAAAF